MVNKEDLFPIGIGTWKIDCENFEPEIPGLLHSCERGQNYLALYMSYNNGQIVRQIKKFLDQTDREKLFICANLEHDVLTSADVEKQLDEYLQILGLDYVDSLQIHDYSVSRIPLAEVYGQIRQLQDAGKVRYTGISNVNLEELKKVQQETKLDFFEGVYNLECKAYEDTGVLSYCKDNGIQFICYQALRRNRTAMRNYNVLVDLAQKYGKTQNQILLNWIIKEKNILPLIKSTNVARIDENLAALDFTVDPADYQLLNGFRSPEFDAVAIDWYYTGGIPIDKLPNQFA